MSILYSCSVDIRISIAIHALVVYNYSYNYLIEKSFVVGSIDEFDKLQEILQFNIFLQLLFS